MSRILRRPMFRGGPVDSRGTGITSGLMDDTGYADGGRVGFQVGGGLFSSSPYNPYGSYNPSSPISEFYMNASRTGPMFPFQRREQDIATANRRDLPTLFFAPKEEQIYERNRPKTPKQFDEAIQKGLNITRSKPFERSDESFPSRKAMEEPNKVGTGTGKGKGDIDLLSDEEDITKQSKLYEKLLGGDDARSQSIYDALLAASPAFFKGRNLREAAPQVLESINKSGAFDKPRDIKQAAAQLAIQRKILMDKASAEAKTKEEIVLAGIAGRDKSFEDRIQEVLIRNQGVVGENDLFTAARARLPGFKGKLVADMKLQPNSIYLSGLTFYETDEQGNLKREPIIDYRTTRAVAKAPQ
jgi:hypothetical protein